ncbi:hypothetical protein AB0N61_03290 [Microbacterium sp. NPDC089320]|uniref:hypothetical protein n=1 Tax=Microbacterium sp. NPDC089320 TaxID=3155182 RepID=UPI00342FB089
MRGEAQSGLETMVQTSVTIDGSSWVLSQDQDPDDLRRRIEDAIVAPGKFVHLVVVGNRAVSVLITPTSRVAVTEATVQFDARDTGDVDFPYGGFYDAL